MNSRIALLTCALCAAACGGSETRPATYPSNANDPQMPAEVTVTNANPQPINGAEAMRSTGAVTASDPLAYGSANSLTPAPTPRATSATAAPSTISPYTTQPVVATANTPRDTVPPAAGSVTTDTTKPDNTKMNVRDRASSAVTPIDQGNSKTELAISASIRKAVVADKSLSFTAKNVKIITVGSKVTLRGPVKTEQEKATIEARARQAPGVTEVDDQLEVK